MGLRIFHLLIIIFVYLPRNAEKFIMNPKIPLSGGVVPVSLRKRGNIQIITKESSSDLWIGMIWQVSWCVSSGSLVTLNCKDLS